MTTSTEFAADARAGAPYAFSERVKAAYDGIAAWMSTQPHMYGFDADGPMPELSYSSPYQVARHFFWYFQTHFAKAYHSLLSLSDEAAKRGSISWLDEPHISVLDIGAGTGAATAALLDLLCEYHHYREARKCVVSPKTLDIVPIEPSSDALLVFRQLLSLFKPELKRNGVELCLTEIREEFPHPECVEALKRTWQVRDPSLLLAISSNVIRPTQHWFDRMMSILKRSAPQAGISLGAVEADAYRELLQHYGFERYLALDIATRDKTPKGVPLFEALARKVADFTRRLGQPQSPFVVWSTKESLTTRFVTAEGTYWASRNAGQIGKTSYLHELRGGTTRTLQADVTRTRTLEPANLELAWVRTRNHMFYDDLVDEVEIRLADFAWQSYLERLRAYVSVPVVSALKTGQCLSFSGPKSERSDRPRYLLRMQEQIVSAGITQSTPQAFEPPDGNRILGNRINPHRDEFFYEPWLRHFKRYSSLASAPNRPDTVICKLDIKSFYVRIIQNRLYRDICEGLGIDSSSRLRNIVHALTIRPLCRPPHENNRGLPQSGVVAGAWSNRYLFEVDSVMLGAETPSARFYRFADDMAIIGLPDEVQSHKRRLEKAIEPRGLALNESKTEVHRLDAYLLANREDPSFNSLAKRCRRVLNSLYHIPAPYMRARARDRESFLRFYANLLRSLSVYVPDYPYWLNRKIHQRSSLRHRLVHAFRGLRVRYPPYDFSAETADTESWSRKFLSMNPHWRQERDRVVSALVEFFSDGLHALITPEGEVDVKARRKVRFAANRLSLLGIGPVADSVYALLEQMPWVLSPKIALKALVDAGFSTRVLTLGMDWHQRRLPCGRNEDGEQILLGCVHTLCAAACRALSYGEATTELSEFLWSVLYDNRSHLAEKLAASEALLRTRCEPAVSYDQLLQVSREAISSPYLLKNLVLLLARTNRPDRYEVLGDLGDLSESLVVLDAVRFALSGETDIFTVPEPRIIERYYASWYPDVPTRPPSSSIPFFPRDE